MSTQNDKSSENQLQEHRDEIDRIDQEILSLLKKRVTQVEAISEWKAKNKKAIQDLSREKTKLEVISEGLAEEDRSHIRAIFQRIIDYSKLVQARPQKSKMKAKVGIVGMGLMGGSLYKALSAYHPNLELELYDLNSQEAKWPMTKDLGKLFGCQYLFLCIPPKNLESFLLEHGESIPPSCYVVDFASTKEEICNFIEEQENCRFTHIPAHPIVGKESSGFESSEADLYVGKKIVLCCEIERVPKELAELLEGIGLQIKMMSAADHDEVFGVTSHLPHLIALSLVLCGEPQLAHKIVPQSFRDLTRVAGASYGLWKDIFLSNREKLNAAVTDFQRVLSEVNGSLEDLEKDFEKVKKIKKEYIDDHSYEESPFRKPAA